MNSIILIAKAETSLELLFSHLRAKWQPYSNAVGALVVEGETGPVFISSDQSVLEDYEPGQRRVIETQLPSPRFFVIDYVDLTLAKEVTHHLASNLGMLIDVNTGIPPMTDEVFAHHLREDPHWDWHARL